MPLTNEKFRTLALALPDAHEEEHWGKPSFRVKKKIFATLWVKERRAVLKLSLEQQDTVCREQPEIFQVTPWGHQGWTSVELAKVETKLIGALIKSAWENVAPKPRKKKS